MPAEYIRIFIRCIFKQMNIFGYSFNQYFAIWIYSDIHSWGEKIFATHWCQLLVWRIRSFVNNQEHTFNHYFPSMSTFIGVSKMHSNCRIRIRICVFFQNSKWFLPELVFICVLFWKSFMKGCSCFIEGEISLTSSLLTLHLTWHDTNCTLLPSSRLRTTPLL